MVGEQKTELNISVPLKYINIPEGMVIANDVPSNIDVRVYGSRSIIRAITTNGIVKLIDLKNATAGKFSVHITTDGFSLPGAVRVLRVQPSNIEITLEPLVLSDLPIKPVLKGRVAEYYKVLKTEVYPSRVVLSGPESVIKSINYIKTLPIDIDGASNDITKETELDLQGLNLKLEEKKTYEVTVHIVPAQSTRRITHIPVQIETSKPDVLWWPKIVSVTLRGPILELREIKATDIYVGISIKELECGIHSIEPECIIPEGFTLVEIIPQSIKVNIPQQEESNKLKDLKD